MNSTAASRSIRYRWQWLRRLSQAAFLFLFLLLLWATVSPLWSGIPTDLFLRLDPLAALVAGLASRSAAINALWAIPLAVLTLAFGRFFCSWGCPLGTLVDIVRLPSRRWPRTTARWKHVKTGILAATLVAALAGSAVLAVLDPLPMLERALATGASPLANQGMQSALQGLYDADIGSDTMVAIDQNVRQAIWTAPLVESRWAWVTLGLLIVVLALNLLCRRFWCRYLCPLGALFSWLARLAPFSRRVSDDCVHCDLCTRNCRMLAIEPGGATTGAGECVDCGECVDVCPKRAVSFGFGTPTLSYDPKRRRALLALGGGIVGGLALAFSSRAEAQSDPLVRPPGAQNGAFLDRCIRCGACVKVCPTSVLQPAMFEAGLEGTFAPHLLCDRGYCEWTCNDCGQVCPTSAIEHLPLERKQQTVIGLATIDHQRCLAWQNTPCIVCEEVCPLPKKAVELQPPRGLGAHSIAATPFVREDLCIGCGMCEFKCPVRGPAAIVVEPVRSH